MREQVNICGMEQYYPDRVEFMSFDATWELTVYRDGRAALKPWDGARQNYASIDDLPHENYRKLARQLLPDGR